MKVGEFAGFTLRREKCAVTLRHTIYTYINICDIVNNEMQNNHELFFAGASIIEKCPYVYLRTENGEIQ